MKLNKTYIAIFSTVSFSFLFSYATNINDFNVIISQDKSNYDVTKWIDTGNTRCNTISPLEEEIYKGKSFTQFHSDCEKEQQKDSDIRWVGIDSYSESKIGNLLLDNCSQILNGNHGTTNGVYSIINNSNEINVLCDMKTDGGGWTLSAYAGNISNNKISTTGQPDKYFQPLLFKYGTMDVNALSTRTSFSRFDLFKNKAKGSDEILFKQTDNPSHMVIFPVQHKDFFGREVSEGQFIINSSNRDLDYMKMTNSGDSNWKTVTNNVKWSYVGLDSSSYPGIDWNVSEGLNCDNCGLNYNTGLTHRSIIYWETLEDKYQKQWFHASVLTLKDSTAPINNKQGFEFWYREK